MNYYIGIDPGQSGGLAIINSPGTLIRAIKFKDKTFSDISEEFIYITQLDGHLFAIIEKVHAMPKQGVSSTFKFGQSYGFLLGMLTAHKIPYDIITPQRWQKEINCLSKGDKNITKQKAQQFYPNEKITHAIADAILIAEYAKRIYF